jgi:predicted DNA-binding transcriptional regulator YafY
MTKLERLLNLTAALINTVVPLTADDIRARVEGYSGSDATFRRAFERDKDELREMGIPISVLTVPGTDPPLTGYRIDAREYAGPAPELTPDELATLHLAANIVKVEGLPTESAFWKFGGAPRALAEGEPMVAIRSDAALGPLFRAASERRLARFVYHGEDRELETQRLLFSRGHWYVSGYDRGRADERIFRVDRISGSVDLGERGTFSPRGSARSDPVVKAWELGDGEPVTARVLVDADQAVWAAHQLGRDAVVETRADGSVVLSLTVRNPDAFRSFVLSFLEHAEVLEPDELRDHIVQWLEALAS